MDSPVDVTAVLKAVSGGDQSAAHELFRVVYEELRRIAAGQRRRWVGDETLNTTALVHEAYIKLVKQDEANWETRAHFFAAAATAMRHILLNYAERQVAAKRGGGAQHVPLDDSHVMASESAEELLQLNRALEKLTVVHARSGRVVECRFFGGFDIRETASTLQVSTATVERDWAFARAWLRRAMADEGEVGE
jgi:RNA polymerase sigma factor (TIGR02999 family)